MKNYIHIFIPFFLFLAPYREGHTQYRRYYSNQKFFLKKKKKDRHIFDFLFNPIGNHFSAKYQYRRELHSKKGIVLDLVIHKLNFYYYRPKNFLSVKHGLFLHNILYPFPQFFYETKIKDTLSDALVLSIGKKSDELVGMLGLQVHYRKFRLYAGEDSILSIMWDAGEYLAFGGSLENLLNFNFIFKNEEGVIRFGFRPSSDYYLDHLYIQVNKFIEKNSGGVFKNLSFTYYTPEKKAFGFEKAMNPMDLNLYNRTDPTFFLRSRSYSTYRMRITLSGKSYITNIEQIPFSFSIAWKLIAMIGGDSVDQVYQIGLPIQMNMSSTTGKSSVFLTLIPYFGRFYSDSVYRNSAFRKLEEETGPSMTLRFGFRKEF